MGQKLIYRTNVDAGYLCVVLLRPTNKSDLVNSYVAHMLIKTTCVRCLSATYEHEQFSRLHTTN